jgi:hypothetical protein
VGNAMPWGVESCGCRAVIQHGIRSVTTYVEHCTLHDSAPDLLAALERLTSWFPLEPNTNLMLDKTAAAVFERDKEQARAAIAKAKGSETAAP